MTNAYADLYAARRRLLRALAMLPALSGTGGAASIGVAGIDEEVAALSSLVEGLVHDAAHYYLAKGVLPPTDAPVDSVDEIVDEHFPTEELSDRNELETSAVTCLVMEAVMPEDHHRGPNAKFAHGALLGPMTMDDVEASLEKLYNDRNVKRAAKVLIRAYLR